MANTSLACPLPQWLFIDSGSLLVTTTFQSHLLISWWQGDCCSLNDLNLPGIMYFFASSLKHFSLNGPNLLQKCQGDSSGSQNEQTFSDQASCVLQVSPRQVLYRWIIARLVFVLNPGHLAFFLFCSDCCTGHTSWNFTKHCLAFLYEVMHFIAAAVCKVGVMSWFPV